MLPRSVLIALADSLEAAGMDRTRLADYGAQTLGQMYPWLDTLADRFVTRFEVGPRPRRREIAHFLRDDPSLQKIFGQLGEKLRIERRIGPPAHMQPASAARSWAVPAITSAGALADWLMLSPAELDWFADLKDLARKGDSEKLIHYRCRLLSKRSGGVRLIEAPKARLKMIQQRVLATILDKIPAHPAAHGFVRGRSIQTFAAPHAGQKLVLRLDLQDFFASIPGVRTQSFFRTAGYPETVSDLLGGLCTNAAPASLLRDVPFEVRALYVRPHLPQGAPTSPALANLCAYRADCRLAGLAAAAGANYTRYADDLAFSGDRQFERSIERFAAQAAAILIEEGFRVHHRKTRVMRRGVRQHLAGLAVNDHVNVVRADFDRLKAILTNCSRHGPATQNRENHPHFREHLEGRLSFFEHVNPEKSKRLRALFDRIHW